MAISSRAPLRRSVRAFLDDLIERLSRLPQVRQILNETDCAWPRVWIAIEAEPWEFSVRRPVYDAELKAMLAHPEVEADFRLINTAEYPGVPLDHLLPSDAALLYAR